MILDNVISQAVPRMEGPKSCVSGVPIKLAEFGRLCIGGAGNVLAGQCAHGTQQALMSLQPWSCFWPRHLLVFPGETCSRRRAQVGS